MNAVDTNVLVYCADPADAPRQVIARRIIDECYGAPLLWQVACEFVAACRKLSRFGLTPAESWDFLDGFLRMFPLVLPSARVLEQARILHADQQWAFWDAMLVSACLEAGVTCLYSEDVPGRAPPSGLQIVNPFH